MKIKVMERSFAIIGILLMAIFGVACKEKGVEKEKADTVREDTKGEEVVDKSILDKPWDKLTAEDMAKMTAVIETNMGIIKFKFFPKESPNHCKNFIRLAKDGFYNELIFHRVIKGFMIQGGCPSGTGTGGPGWNVNAEFNKNPHLKGTVSMARANDPNSAGSQFFICLDKQAFLDGKYTVFGQVTEGQEVVDKIGALPTGPGDRPRQEAKMLKVFIETAR